MTQAAQDVILPVATVLGSARSMQGRLETKALVRRTVKFMIRTVSPGRAACGFLMGSQNIDLGTRVMPGSSDIETIATRWGRLLLRAGTQCRRPTGRRRCKKLTGQMSTGSGEDATGPDEACSAYGIRIVD